MEVLDSKSEIEEVEGEIEVEEKERICSVCFESESETNVLYPLSCDCGDFVHENCFEGKRKKWRLRYYQKNPNKEMIFSEIFCGVNRFLTFSIHRIVHGEWIHPFLPYRRCTQCHQLYEMVSYSHQESSTRNIFKTLFGEGKLQIFLLLFHLNVVDPVFVFGFFFFVATSFLERSIFYFAKTILATVFIAFPYHYLGTIFFLNLYNRKLCQYYKPRKIGFKHSFMDIYRKSRTKKQRHNTSNHTSRFEYGDLAFEIHTFGTCEDLIVRIFSYLSVRDLVGRVSLVCHHFHIIINFPQNCTDLKTLKLIERFYGMHNELWKSAIEEKKTSSFSNFEKNMFQKSIEEGEIVSYRDVYISNLMEMAAMGDSCAYCQKPITVKQKLDGNYVSGYCEGCVRNTVHRHCIDQRRMYFGNCGVNIVDVARTRFWILVRYYYQRIIRRRKRVKYEINHGDEAHRNMRYRKCPTCTRFFPNLRRKRGKSVSGPLIYSIFASLGWASMAFLEVAVCFGFFQRSYKLGKAVYFGGKEGWEDECQRQMSLWTLFLEVLCYRLGPVVAFFLFYMLFVLFSFDALGNHYHNMMVSTYNVESINNIVEEEEEEEEVLMTDSKIKKE